MGSGDNKRSGMRGGQQTEAGGISSCLYTPGFSREYGFSREHGENEKNGKRPKTKLVTERRAGDRPNGKSQYKTDFGSSWKKAKCGSAGESEEVRIWGESQTLQRAICQEVICSLREGVY